MEALRPAHRAAAYSCAVSPALSDGWAGAGERKTFLSQSIGVGLGSGAAPPAASGRGSGKGTFPAIAKLAGRLRGNGTGPEIGSPGGNASAGADAGEGQAESCGRAEAWVSGDWFGAVLSVGAAAASAEPGPAGIASSGAAFGGDPTEAGLKVPVGLASANAGGVVAAASVVPALTGVLGGTAWAVFTDCVGDCDGCSEAAAATVVFAGGLEGTLAIGCNAGACGGFT